MGSVFVNNMKRIINYEESQNSYGDGYGYSYGYGDGDGYGDGF